MLSVDLHYLLEKAFSDGFTNDNLSNVTGVSIDLINRVDEKKLTQEDIKQLIHCSVSCPKFILKM